MNYAILYFFMLTLKGFVGPVAILKFLPNTILLAGLLHNMLPRYGRLHIRRYSPQSYTYLWVLFLIIWAISILRTARGGATLNGHINDIAAIFLFSAVVYFHVATRFRTPQVFDEVFTRETLRLLLLPSMAIAVLLLAYIVGYNHPGTEVLRRGEDMVILKALGIHMAKKSVPFTNAGHPNLFGIWAGATFILNFTVLFALKPQQRVKILLSLNGLSIFVFLLFTDSRGTVFSTIVTAALVYLTYKFRMAGVLRVVVVVVPFLPFIFLGMMGLLAQTSLADLIARGEGGAQNLSTLSARSVIWAECMQEVNNPQPIHLIGWGEHGQATAGVSQRYAHIFPPEFYGEGKTDLVVTHNFFFQAFFDVGYLGLGLILLILYIAMNHAIFLFRRGYRAGLVYIGFLVYFVLSGALESTFGNHFRSYTVNLLLIVSSLFAFRSEYDRIAQNGEDT